MRAEINEIETRKAIEKINENYLTPIYDEN